MPNVLLQKTQSGFSVSAAARTIQYGSNVTAGSLLLIWIAKEENTPIGNGTVTVSDNVNGAWTQAGAYSRGGTTRNGSWWYFANSAGGARPIVTVTPSTSSYLELSIHEYSVPSPTGVGVEGSSANTGTGTSITTGNSTVSGPGRLVVAGYGQGNQASPTVTVAAPFTVETFQGNGLTEGGGTADDPAASSTEGATFTTNASFSIWVAMAVTFKTGAVGTPFDYYGSLMGGLSGCGI